MASLLQQIAASFGTRKFAGTFARLYPKCENISIDYAVLEPRSAKGEQESQIICLPADFGWNDLGSWTALHEHLAGKHRPQDDNLISSQGAFTPHSRGNYIHAPGKFVAALGVSNLVVVETEDALLITTRDQAQDVGKIVNIWIRRKCVIWYEEDSRWPLVVSLWANLTLRRRPTTSAANKIANDQRPMTNDRPIKFGTDGPARHHCRRLYF